ncbi:type I-E CRISPR-associated protein Cas5/CasD [Rhizobium paknamense]|uniref:CRISPR system Cascade subunit CasD n=1 Tax=Rhizobium paknamense TaxID=1206817 RepID=A0ABU0IEQ1_9HYPH|nr:type I-E CRISPR-associated protein Cas5/CasD [Rhizobium paknamense]MDQ0455721.1 CRISPR system Cascade subunit CasD [Rhizobium paknamense]
MAELVVFRMEAALAAFGDLQVGERRGSWRRPSHSGIAGLLAAALGLTRDDPAVPVLAQGFLMAVRSDRIGPPLADFHTAQTPPQSRKRSFATRRQELADKDLLGTIVSRRDYWMDVAFTVLIWPKPALTVRPQALAEALNRPAFPLFAGRRSCPFSAPLAARAVSAETVSEGFATYDANLAGPLEQAGLPCLQPGRDVALDAEFPQESWGAITRLHTETRRDLTGSRQSWQFALRQEVVGVFHAPETAGAAA